MLSFWSLWSKSVRNTVRVGYSVRRAITDATASHSQEEVAPFFKLLGHSYNTSCICSLEQKKNISAYNIKLVKNNIFYLYST